MRQYDVKNAKRIELDYRVKQCGIYCIYNNVNNKFYIGSSVFGYHRIRGQHLIRLRKNAHTNPHLQAAWNFYGEESFEFFILEETSKDEMLDVEQLYLDNTGCLNNKIGYNINTKAQKTILTPAQREKIRQSKLGKPRSEETKRKISESQMGKKRPDTFVKRRKETMIKRGLLNKDGSRTEKYNNIVRKAMIEKGLLDKEGHMTLKYRKLLHIDYKGS